MIKVAIKKEKDGKIVYQQGGVTGRLLSAYAGGQLLRLEIEAGVRLEPHLVDFAAEFYVLNGSGIFIYEGESAEIACGEVVSADANTARGFENNGSENLEVLVIKH